MFSGKRSFFALLLTLAPLLGFAQMIEDPTKWTFEAKNKGGDKYELIFHLNIKAGWHIWSLHPGGDGYEIAPSFKFDQVPGLKITGEPKEKGKATTESMDGIEGKITYLSGKIDYIQQATITKKGKITGKLNYQVCNDKMCLPPKDKNFVFEIK